MKRLCIALMAGLSVSAAAQTPLFVHTSNRTRAF